MGTMWFLYLLAVVWSRVSYSLPVGTPQTYPQDGVYTQAPQWLVEHGWYVVLPSLVLLLSAVGILFGCLWCYRHKDCKTDGGNDNQLFAPSTNQLQDGRRNQLPPESDFSEPVNNNNTEDNNNGPISLRELQNIENNNAVAYIVSENEERNRGASRESVVEFEPLPVVLGPVLDPLESCADWFGEEDFPRERLQYLREIGRGWFGRVVEGEVDTPAGVPSSVAVRILNQNASLQDKARFLSEARVYRELRHENVLAFLASSLQEDPWILVFELCPMTLEQYLIANRPQMATLNEAGVPLRLVCDITSALSHMHARGFYYGEATSRNVLVRGEEAATARCVLGQYHSDTRAADNNSSASDVWWAGVAVWEVSAWSPAPAPPPLAPPPALPHADYQDHLYQVMQLCWHPTPQCRPTASQVYALLNHLYSGQQPELGSSSQTDRADFEDRWERLKPNNIPVIDEHRAIVHAPSTSMVSHFTNSEEFASQSLSVDMDTAVSRSSSIMSDNLLSVQAKSESLNNLHGSYEDVRNQYIDRQIDSHDLSDTSVDPWLKDIIAGSQDDVSYYKDVSDVIKNLDNILNSEKTSSSESSHQASPSRDNLSLDCKRENPVQSSLVKSPGIRNFQNIAEIGSENEEVEDEDRDTIGTLSHSFERHSDTTSQHTLANLTPDTPNQEHWPQDEVKVPEQLPTIQQDMPNNVVENCSVTVDVASVSVSERELSEDCQTTCDNEDTGDGPEVSAKSIDETISELNDKLENNELLSRNRNMNDINNHQNLSSATTDFLANEIQSSIPNSVIINHNSEVNEQCDIVKEETRLAVEINEAIELATQLDSITDISSLPSDNKETENSTVEIFETIKPECTADVLETNTDIANIKLVSEELVADVIKEAEKVVSSDMLPEDVTDQVDTWQDVKEVTYQNFTQENESLSQVETLPLENDHSNVVDDTDVTISESTFVKSLDTASTLPIGNKPDLVQNINQQEETKGESLNDVDTNATNESTVYMDLTNATCSKIKKDNIDNNLKHIIKTCVENTNNTAPAEFTFTMNESTIYLDLPNVINDTHDFLHIEKLGADCELKDGNEPSSLPTSTPNANEAGKEVKPEETGRITPEMGPGVTLTKLEQRCVPESFSPLDSPSKSHPTDTYDENSSVLLGPFENSEPFKPVKNLPDLELPKEELLAFSSNFSEINLETPSPLRDVNFLNEVPDILNEDLKSKSLSITDKEVAKLDPIQSLIAGPSTPPNSPGNFLASTSQNKYVVETDFEPDYSEASTSAYANAIELNEIEMQITSKLAIAENENNMNIEYSGPLTVEGFVRDDFVQEAYLAGNGQEVFEDSRPMLTLDADCMAALRNELELKLPLAQVASIEPAEAMEEAEAVAWCPPELIVNYAGALSPIAEETHRQLSAYENDLLWTASHRTESSESYPEPCNNSTEEVSSLPSGGGGGNTYTVQEPQHDTYSIHDQTLSKDSTAVPNSSNTDASEGLVKALDDQTYTKMEDKERISQVSPFLLSPTTDTSLPENSDNVTGISTLSKATVPEQKANKQTESLSKATSIDSWCSNDTLFNVEDNFDDLAMDGEGDEGKDHSEDSNTLNEDNADVNESTYNVIDDKSRDSFSPDSLTANCTYTKLRSEDKSSPIIVTNSDVNESSPKDSQTKDLAYGTLVSGLGTYSSCSTDFVSANEDPWRMAQPELVRRSPLHDDTVNLTPPTNTESFESKNDLEPKLKHEPSIKKLDSIDVTCFDDDTGNGDNCNVNERRDSPKMHYKNMSQSVHSTPLIEVTDENNCSENPQNQDIQSPESLVLSIPNFQNFVHSVELRPQEKSGDNISTTNNDTDLLLESESTRNPLGLSGSMPSYASFEASAGERPQEVNSNPNQTGNTTEEFQNFESSVRERPQDLSSIAESSVLLSKDDGNIPQPVVDSTDDTASTVGNLVIDDPSVTNLELDCELNSNNSLQLGQIMTPFIEEVEQPHSIIMTVENVNNDINATYNSHEDQVIVNTYDSHIKPNEAISGNGDYDTAAVVSETETNEKVLESNAINGIDGQQNDQIKNETTLNCQSELNQDILNENGRASPSENVNSTQIKSSQDSDKIVLNNEENGVKTNGEVSGKMLAVTGIFLENEKKYIGNSSYIPLLTDIRFTGPSSEIMSTSFCQESPVEPAPPSGPTENLNGPIDNVAKEWDSDTEDSHSSNSSSCEFVWKDGDGLVTSLVSTAAFDHQRTNSHHHSKSGNTGGGGVLAPNSAPDSAPGSGESGSGSDGDEVEFVPSSWDCSAAPSKSSLRVIDQAQSFSGESKKKVVFKRQKYHCVYEYPREVVDPETEVEPELGPPEFGPFSEWIPVSEDPEINCGLYTGHSLDFYKLHPGIPLNAPYEEDDFYISSSARPFESFGVMSSEFFPGMHLKGGALERRDDVTELYPRLAPLDVGAALATPDSGLEDITPGSTEEYKPKVMPDTDPSQTPCWKPDSGSSSESVSPSSPGSEALGGLRHTRDKLKLDLPPSPHVPSPKVNRVFNFVLDKPKRRHPSDEHRASGSAPLVMTDDTPVASTPLPATVSDTPLVEPTFSTFGKGAEPAEPEPKLLLSDADKEKEVKSDGKEPGKGEGTVLDSGDEDSGIESSAKTSLERNKAPNLS